jgi:hypothetical protein
MKTLIPKRLLPFALLAFFGGQAPAQSVPALINYQGQLTDANGNALPTADYMLTFKIYDAATGGNIIWGPQVFDGAMGTTGHRGKVPVVQGYFNLMLGETDTASRSIAEAFNGATRYVEVWVGSNASPILPRQQILTAPFAFKANSAEKLVVPGGSATTAVAVDEAGNVGIGTASPDTKLSVEGNAAFSGYMGIGAGWLHSVRLWLGNGTNSEIMFLDGQNVKMRLVAYSGGQAYIQAGSDYITGSTADIVFGGLNGYPNHMVIKSNGNVGVGTINPSTKLEVAGTVKANTFQGDGSGLTGIGTSALASEIINRLVPAGTIVAFGGASPPAGWLLCDGTAVSQTGYSNLWAAIGPVWGHWQWEHDFQRARPPR